MTFAFFAEGVPQAQGSAKGFVVRSRATGKLRAVITTDNANLKPWRESVRDAARAALEREGLAGRLLVGAVRLDVTFLVPPPKAVATKMLKGRVVPCDHGRDVDKLLRAVFDALSGLVYADDRQVNAGRYERRYQHPSKPPGVHVMVTGTPGDLATPALLPLDDLDLPELPDLAEETA